MIRKAVYSFYSYPFRTWLSYAGFTTLEDFLNAWTLSVHLAQGHFDEIELVTDSYGKAMLLDCLNLPFTRVKNELDAVIPAHVKDLYWTFGKLWAYSVQEEPFIHVDYDVFLWNKLPDKILTAPMFGQNAECDIWKVDIYRQGYKALCGHLKYKPDDWVTIYPYIHKHDIAINVGIIGGNDIKFLRKYATTAIDIITHSENKEAFEIIKRLDKLTAGNVIHGCNVVIEQYLYSRLCVADKRWNDMQFLLDKPEIFTGHKPHISVNIACQEIGFTHLIGLKAKQNLDTMRRLKHRIEKDYSSYGEKIAAIVKNGKFGRVPPDNG
jgi:hypothetical protein